MRLEAQVLGSSESGLPGFPKRSPGCDGRVSEEAGAGLQGLTHAQ